MGYVGLVVFANETFLEIKLLMRAEILSKIL